MVDVEAQGDTHLSVLSSVDRVVDRLEGHSGRVHFLSWSPDGTKLGELNSNPRMLKLCRPKARARATWPILLKCSLNLYFSPEIDAQKCNLKIFKNQPSVLPNILFFRYLLYIYLKNHAVGFFWEHKLKFQF